MHVTRIHGNELLDHTRAFWQRRTTSSLTCEDAREIAVNVCGFFDILHEWAANDTSSSRVGKEVRRDG